VHQKFAMLRLLIVVSQVVLLCAQNTGTNPFLGKTLYVNPSYQAELDTSIATASGTTKTTLQSMRDVPSAYWIDVMAKINGNTTNTVEGILKDAQAKGGQLVTFIVYDLPNRDCHAKASNGEICCTYNADLTCNYDAAGDCADGISTYKAKYIDPLATLFGQYQNAVPIVLIIEPDSLPNLSTNQGDPHCGNSATKAAYETGIPYAIQTLAAKCSKCTMYCDAAHGGWLGWQTNMQAFSAEIAKLGIAKYLRGYATNTANYQPIGVMCPTETQNGQDYCLQNPKPTDPCCADPCNLESQYNPGNNELNYVMYLNTSITAATGYAAHFVTDTGRNGIANMRKDCANWCNIRGAGIGLTPRTNTGTPLLDAFHWLKTPGESDGCTQQLPDGSTCPRYDSFCGSSDSIGSQGGEPRAPQAGNWFDYQIKQLADNAHMN